MSGFAQSRDGVSVLSPRAAMTEQLHRKWSSDEDSDGTATQNNAFVNTAVTHGEEPAYTAGKRGLAPPVDIVPASRRRPAPNGNPLAVGTSQMQFTAKHSQMQRPRPNARTASQTAVLEADAVETLAFMASPNTSGHTFSQSQSSSASQHFMSQTSPLRSQFTASGRLLSPKRVAFSEYPSKDAVVDKAALINRMLDDIGDGSDTELEEAFEIADRAKAVKRTV